MACRILQHRRRGRTGCHSVCQPEPDRACLRYSQAMSMPSPDRDQPGPFIRAVSGFAFLWILLRVFNRRTELDAEHPMWIMADYPRTDQLKTLALQLAESIDDDAEAIAAIRAAGGRRTEWRKAAAWMRSNFDTWEHRTNLRAARLLQAAADGRLPIPPEPAQEALFQAVDKLEALPLDQAFSLLAAEVPALGTLRDNLTAVPPEELARKTAMPTCCVTASSRS